MVIGLSFFSFFYRSFNFSLLSQSFFDIFKGFREKIVSLVAMYYYSWYNNTNLISKLLSMFTCLKNRLKKNFQDKIFQIWKNSVLFVTGLWLWFAKAQAAYAWEVETVFGIKISGGDRPLNSLVSQVLNVLYGLAGSSAVLMILVGSYKYISAGGDPKKAAEAKETWRAAITGLILILTSYLIAQFIGGDEVVDPDA